MADRRKLCKWKFVVYTPRPSRQHSLIFPDNVTILGVLGGEFSNCNAVLSVKFSSKKYFYCNPVSFLTII